jgi:CO dehydrogenase maturation factor
MKIAISGKGGTGKSTISAALALILAKKNFKVLALDTDPDANLAQSLGIPIEEQKKIIPISKQIELIEERTGAKVSSYGQVFKLNPEVSDIADKYSTKYNGVSLIVLGAVKSGGGGCACPENILIRALVTDLILFKDDFLIMDMEAGIEHLGRAPVSGVDILVIIVEPGQKSIDSAIRIIGMAHEIGLKNIKIIANKIKNNEDLLFVKNALKDPEFIGDFQYSENIIKSDRNGVSVIDGLSDSEYKSIENMLEKILKEKRK